MQFGRFQRKFNWTFLLILLSQEIILKSASSYDVSSTNAPRGCSFIKCKSDEQCVNRKFWCRYPPCPNMIYCAKTRRESRRGPSSCETVRCSKGHLCLVIARHCSWQGCKDEVARCVSEMEYHDGPASCAGFKCPSGQECILRESLCTRRPCKLLKSCVSKKEVHGYLDKCKSLGCLSAHECFLRHLGDSCGGSQCSYRPDCTAKDEVELMMNEKCRGWICPVGQECTAEAQGPCVGRECRITRACQGKIATLQGQTKKTTDKIVFKSTGYTGSPLPTRINLQNRSNASIKLPKETSTSLPAWMELLRREIGTEAVKIWIKKAEEGNNHTEFHRWLESAKDLLGFKAYQLWLDDVRTMTVNNHAFQQWLSSPTTHRPSLSEQTPPLKANTASSRDRKVDGIFETQSVMNPAYQHQGVNIPAWNLPRVIPYLFTPGGHGSPPANHHLGYYILPPVSYPPAGRANDSQSNPRDLLRQLVDDSEALGMKKKLSLMSLLRILREERLLYQEVVNKTRELVSRVRPLLPASDLDELVQKFGSNATDVSNWSWSVVEPRILSENNGNLSENEGKNIEVLADYSDDNVTEFVFVEYDDSTGIQLNQTIPRIVIRVENNLQPPMRFGEIQINNDQDVSERILNISAGINPDEYYMDDLYYKVPESDANMSTTKFQTFRDINHR